MTQPDNLPAVAVSGGRNHTDQGQVWAFLSGYYAARPFRLIVGDCPRGVDKFALAWAKAHDVDVTVFCADWDKFGNAAGPRRNEEMLTSTRDLRCLIAFEGGRGTGHAVYFAERIGLPVFKIGWV